MHMCWNLFNPLLSWLRAGNGLLKLFTHHCSTEILFFCCCFFVLICFYLCCVFVLFFLSPPRKTEVHPLSLLWLNVAYKRSSATLYYLMINMYDIQEPFFTLIICKVYFLVSVVMLLLHTVSGSRKTNGRAPVGARWYFCISFFVFKGTKQTWQQWVKLALWLYMLFILRIK